MKLNPNLRTILTLIFLVLAVRVWEQFAVNFSETTNVKGILTIAVLGIFILVIVSRKWKGE